MFDSLVEFMNPEQYRNTRIPGAVFWNIFTDFLKPDLRVTATDCNLRVLHPEVLAALDSPPEMGQDPIRFG
jgi:uncharacterized protein (DUF2236 family)